MAHKIILPSGNKVEVESSKQHLTPYELVYSIDTKELAIKSEGELIFIGKVADWDDIINKPDLIDLEDLNEEINNLRQELEQYTDNKVEALDTHIRSNYYNIDEIDNIMEDLDIHIRSTYYDKDYIDELETDLEENIIQHVASNYYDINEIDDKLKTLVVDGGNV